MFFLICSVWHFAVAIEGGGCFISSTVRLVQVVKWVFLMAWSKFILTRLNRAVWYHLAISVLILAARVLSAYSCCFLGGWLGLLLMLTCHMPDVVGRLPSSTIISSLTTLR